MTKTKQNANTYRGAQIKANFTSINGTGAKLKKALGWNVYLDGYGYIGWFHNLADARRNIDDMHNGHCSPRISRALEKHANDAGSAAK